MKPWLKGRALLAQLIMRLISLSRWTRWITQPDEVGFKGVHRARVYPQTYLSGDDSRVINKKASLRSRFATPTSQKIGGSGGPSSFCGGLRIRPSSRPVPLIACTTFSVIIWTICTGAPTEKLLLRASEVAETMGLAKSKVYAMVASGELPSIRFGKSVRVPAHALRQLIDERTKDVVPSTNLIHFESRPK